MKFALQFDIDNAAFEASPATEVARILLETAQSVAAFEVSISIGVESGYPVRDGNGNTIGKWSVTP